jgi:hypothetical protein
MTCSLRGVLGVLVVTFLVLVGSAEVEAGWIGPLTVVGVDVGDTNALIVKLSGGTGCGTKLGKVYNDQLYYKEVLSVALAAHLSGKEVYVWTHGCDANGLATMLRFVIGPVWW